MQSLLPICLKPQTGLLYLQSFPVPASSRVLLLCNSYPPEIGAAPLRMQGMAHWLRDAGYEVAVLAGMPNYPTGHIFPEYQKAGGILTEEIEGITVCRLPFSPSHSANRIKRTSSLFSLSGALLRHGGAFIKDFRPERMIISSPPLPLALCGAWLARRYGIPFLLNISDLWPLTAKELGALREGPLYSGLQKAESWLLNQAQGWLGQSEEILHYIRKRGFPEKPAFLYRNLPKVQEAQMSDFPEKAGRRKIVYAGLIGPVQGILDIATQVNFAAHNLELHLYGDGVDRYALETFIQQHPERGVVYKGLLSPEEMFRKFPEYDLALASLRTSVYGAVPSKIYTALAAGLPVVFMGGGEGAALIEQHGTGWTIPAGNLAALEAHLSFLQKLPTESLAQMRKHILQVQQEHFNSRKQGAAFLDFFRKMADG